MGCLLTDRRGRLTVMPSRRARANLDREHWMACPPSPPSPPNRTVMWCELVYQREQEIEIHKIILHWLLPMVTMNQAVHRFFLTKNINNKQNITNGQPTLLRSLLHLPKKATSIVRFSNRVRKSTKRNINWKKTKGFEAKTVLRP